MQYPCLLLLFLLLAALAQAGSFSSTYIKSLTGSNFKKEVFASEVCWWRQGEGQMTEDRPPRSGMLKHWGVQTWAESTISIHPTSCICPGCSTPQRATVAVFYAPWCE